MRKITKQKKIIVLIIAGTIFVTLLSIIFYLGKTFNKNEISLDKCENLTVPQKQQCWDQSLDTILKDHSLDVAFEFVSKLFNQDSVFAADCHHFLHKLGEKSYDQFSKNQTFEFTSKTSYCGYGFYHGFMSKLIAEKTDVQKARKFCEMISQSTDKDKFNALSACLHGFGHGLVDDVPHPILWGKPQAIIEPGLKLCRQISNGMDELFSCSSGVFNGLEINMSAQKYKLSHNTEDPFSICRNQPDEFKRGCYTQMVVAAFIVAGGDFPKTAKFIQSIEENEIAQEAMSALYVDKANQADKNNQQFISECKNLPSNFQLTCIKGVAEGYLKYGPPEQEYINAIDFCNNSELSSDEKSACYSRVLSILRIWYTLEKAEQICNMVDPQYRKGKCIYS